jgi:hypothetical protein
MDFTKFDRLNAYCSISGSVSAVLFASMSGARWNLVAYQIAYCAISAASTFTLTERDATNSANIFTFKTTLTSGFVTAYLSDLGFQASASFSSLNFVGSPTDNGRFYGLFIGYRSGT